MAFANQYFPHFTNATSGWFDTQTTATTIQLQPIYYPAQPEAEPLRKRSNDPLDWLRGRVQECVDKAVLA